MITHFRPVAIVVAMLALLGCTAGPPAGSTSPAAGAAAPGSSRNAAPVESSAQPVVVFLGDSLTAGYGLSEDRAFPALVDRALSREGIAARVINAGVSGDTTAGGLSRVDWLLRQQPDLFVVALGANDGLRGLPLADSEANLRAIVRRARAGGAQVLLAGMLIPPNYGPDYTTRFRDMFPRIAEDLDVPLMPFLLQDVAAEPDLNLPDGLHPNAEGQRIIADNILPYVIRILRARAEG